MKTIKKLKDNIGKVAGSALLVGATLTAGAAAVSAQDNGSSGDLGDYPAPFVNEDGEVDTTVVVGETAEDGNPVSTADVVSAVEIAGSLGAAAFTEEEVNVDVETSGAVAGWSATNGVTLNRQNSDLFLNSATDAEETRLDESDLDLLSETSFESEDNNNVDVEQDVVIGTQHQNFNAEVGDFDDPVLHVTNPTNPTDSQGESLFSASVEFSETMDFTGDADSGLEGNADEYIEDGDTIEMFGQDFEYSDESDNDELVFYGTSESFSIGTNEEAETVTVDGEDHEFDVSYVPSSESEDATVTVDGDTQGASVGDTIDVGGTEVRVTDFYKRSGDEGLGSVEFSIGSDELTIGVGDNADVEVDGDTVDGVSVYTDTTGNGFGETDGMTFYFGAVDSDEDYVEAGGMYEDPLFGLQFHYGGLSGDVAENPAEAIDVESNEDGAASITVNQGEDSADVTFAENDHWSNNQVELSHDEGETFATVEGETVNEDDRLVLNSNDEGALYELTDVTNEVQTIDDGDSETEGDVAVTLENVVTGDTVEIEEQDLQQGDDEFTDPDVVLESESIEGKDFDVTFLEGGGVQFERAGTPGTTQVFPSLYTSSDAAVAFTQETPVIAPQSGIDISTGSGNGAYSTDLELPSTTVSGDNTVTVDVDHSDTNDELLVSVGDVTDASIDTADGSDQQVEFTAGEQVYTLTVDVTTTTDQSGNGNTDADIDHTLSVDANQDSTDSGTLGPAATVIQPEDDEDEEHAYFFEPDVEDGDSGALNVQYTGVTPSTGATGNLEEDVWATADLDSEDNVEVGYNDYGAYTVYDTDADESEEFTYHLPSGQSTAGMAVTGAEGSLSADGGSSSASGSAMSESATGSYADVALDNELEGSDRTASNLILVGGPSVNSLVGELVDENQTMPASDYTEGEGMVQMVDGFGDHSALVVAGHSGEDTRAAGEFLADYRNNQEAMAGQSQVTVSTETGQVVE